MNIKKMFWNFSLFLLVFLPGIAQAKLKVVASLPDLRSIVEAVGKEWVDAQSIAKGTQDPHFLDAKPSYMTRLAGADLLIYLGLELEQAWLDNVVRGARNPKVNPGAKGNLEIGPLLDPEEVPSGSQLSRREGDVHPRGNPHLTLDPLRMAKASVIIAGKLGELDPEHKAVFLANAEAWKKEMEIKDQDWKKRIKATGIQRVVTYHRTLDYFLKVMNLELAEVLEPKPGIAPSVSHLAEVISTMKQKNANVVLIENYFDPTVADKLKELNPKVKVAVVPVSVEGESKINNLFDMYENLVKTIEGMK